MTATAASLIAYLQTLPADTPIKVLEETTIGYSTTTKWVDLDITNPDLSSTVYYNNNPKMGLYLGSN